MNPYESSWSRRQLLLAGALGAAGAAAPSALHAAAAAPATAATSGKAVIAKAIPKSGVALPVIGIGTNAFRTDNYDALRAVLKRMNELGGTVIDTAPSYGESEGVIGRALQELQLRDRFFLSTKFNAAGKGWGPGDITGRASVERSLQRLRTDHLDLLEVHRLEGLDDLMPLMQEYRKAGTIRYLGVTTFATGEHDRMAELIRTHELDFIQVDYSLGNRHAAEKVLPLALERKVAVMVDVPLGGRRGSLFRETTGRTLPPWAAEFGATTWAQFFLKYVVSHPAVTVAIPGSTSVDHLEDNQGAGLIERGKPVLVQTLLPKTTIEDLDEQVVGGRAWPAERQCCLMTRSAVCATDAAGGDVSTRHRVCRRWMRAPVRQ